jgi:hypothetical protein
MTTPATAGPSRVAAEAASGSPYGVLERAALASMVDGQISVICASDTAWSFSGNYASRELAERAARMLDGPLTAGYIVAQYGDHRFVFLDARTLLGECSTDSSVPFGSGGPRA